MNKNEKCHIYHLRTATYFHEIEKNGEKIKVKTGGTPYATVAITINEDCTVNRGVSICSPNDVFVKSIGAAKAIGRLKKAEKANENIYPINGFKRLEEKIIKNMNKKIHCTCNCKKITVRDNVEFDHLGYFKSKPNALEREIFKEELMENFDPSNF